MAAGALSFFLGPFGWLYAAPLKEAAPAIVVFLILCKLLPAMLLYPLLGLLMPLSALAGVSYAWLYNRQGGRASLVDMSKSSFRPTAETVAAAVDGRAVQGCETVDETNFNI